MTAAIPRSDGPCRSIRPQTGLLEFGMEGCYKTTSLKDQGPSQSSHSEFSDDNYLSAIEA